MTGLQLIRSLFAPDPHTYCSKALFSDQVFFGFHLENQCTRLWGKRGKLDSVQSEVFKGVDYFWGFSAACVSPMYFFKGTSSAVIYQDLVPAHIAANMV